MKKKIAFWCGVAAVAGFWAAFPAAAQQRDWDPSGWMSLSESPGEPPSCLLMNWLPNNEALIFKILAGDPRMYMQIVGSGDVLPSMRVSFTVDRQRAWVIDAVRLQNSSRSVGGWAEPSTATTFLRELAFGNTLYVDFNEGRGRWRISLAGSMAATRQFAECAGGLERRGAQVPTVPRTGVPVIPDRPVSPPSYWFSRAQSSVDGVSMCLLGTDMEDGGGLYFKVFANQPREVTLHVGKAGMPPVMQVSARVGNQPSWNVTVVRRQDYQFVAEAQITGQAAADLLVGLTRGGSLAVLFNEGQAGRWEMSLTGAGDAISGFVQCAGDLETQQSPASRQQNTPQNQQPNSAVKYDLFWK